MKKDLFIIRHAKAKEIKQGQDDFDRSLSKRGKEDALLMAHQMKALGIFPDKIYSSPSKRTTMTAQSLADILAYPPEKFIFDKDIYEASRPTLLKIVNQFPDDAHAVFMVGHNPGFTQLADYLSDTSLDFIPTMGIVYLRFEVDSWAQLSGGVGKLMWFKTPKMV